MIIPKTGIWVFNVANNEIHLSEDVIKMFPSKKFEEGISINEFFNHIISAPEIESFQKSFTDFMKAPFQFGRSINNEFREFTSGDNNRFFKQNIFFKSENEIIACIEDITKYKSEEIELSSHMINQKEASKYKTVVDQSANSIIITDTKGNIEYVNHSFCELYGYNSNEVIGKNPSIIKSGNQADVIYKELWQTLIAGKAWAGEFENKTKDGRVVWVSANITPILDNNGTVFNLLGIHEDITEKKQTQQFLKYHMNQMKDVFSAMNDFIFQINRDGVFQYVAPTNSKFISDSQEFVGKSFSDLFSKENATFFQSSIEQVLKKSKILIKEFSLIFNGKKVWFEARISPVSKLEVIAVIRDITRRVEATESLKKSELKFRNVFEQSGDAILLIKNGRFFECNQAALDMLAYESKEQLLFKSPNDISPVFQEDGLNSIQKADQMIKLAIKKGSHRFEWYHTKKDGQIFPVEVLLTAAKDFDEEMILHTVWRDISDQKNKEREIITAKEQAERADKFKSAFLANMSHEIRTPMNGILGFTELLSDPDLSQEEKDHFIDIIRKSGLNMLNIINDILDISKIESGEVELSLKRHNIIENLNYLYDFFMPEVSKKGLKWIKEYDENNQLNIHVDQYKLNELLTNLIKNAIKYSHTGQISYGIQERETDVLFFVKDTGIGIPYEKQDHIFDRFIQADNDVTHMVYGTGLGLAISKAYVEMHEGEIWLESTPGKGSTFFFTIPKKIKA
mgnify:CR=1 FL=1